MVSDVLSAHAPNPFEVGYFRRSRTIKGKRAPLSCKEISRHIEGGPGALATLNS
ncbi:Single hybrid motif superfamily protein [Perilla frutescens var. hirtella]|nr:Single hybrid motif superfamily protein [Perilla frutescens var. hirtella]